jgi:hypothetical protein
MKTKNVFRSTKKKEENKIKAKVGVPLIASPLISKLIKMSNKQTGKGEKLVVSRPIQNFIIRDVAD